MTPRANTSALLAAVLLCSAGCSRIATRPPAPPEPPPPASAPPVRTSAEPAALSPQAAPAAIRDRIAALAAQGHPAVDRDGLGYYLDVQQARLQQIGSPQLQLIREGEIIRLRLPASAGFDIGRAALSPAGERLIDQLAIVLREFGASLVAVHGHTDDTGNPEHNRRLSGQRAQAVAARLRLAGLEPRRLVAIGHGPSQPLADNDTETGRERNRRVELELLPILR